MTPTDTAHQAWLEERAPSFPNGKTSIVRVYQKLNCLVLELARRAAETPSSRVFLPRKEALLNSKTTTPNLVDKLLTIFRCIVSNLQHNQSTLRNCYILSSRKKQTITMKSFLKNFSLRKIPQKDLFLPRRLMEYFKTKLTTKKVKMILTDPTSLQTSRKSLLRFLKESAL